MHHKLASKIESILFVASKPLGLDIIAKALGVSSSDAREALQYLKERYNSDESGIHILEHDTKVQMITNPDHAEVIDGFIKEEATGELTRAQLETLTVIAYRGPITRPELEQVRGVNCVIILRNLMIRGLVEQEEDTEKLMQVYSLSFDVLRHLGINTINELPEYEHLCKHEYIERVLED